MRVGIFDSGMGGLTIAHAIATQLPDYDYIYLGDTARVPYGNRSQEAVFSFTLQAVEYLFSQDCQLIILACNTASAEALRRIQSEWLPTHFPERRVLGVLIPAAEAAIEAGGRRIGVIATASSVAAGAFPREITKLDTTVIVFQQAAPLLVPLVEYAGDLWVGPILDSYLAPLREKQIDTLILGCTHYACLKDEFRQRLPGVTVISQDEVVPSSLQQYLSRHPELEEKLSRDGFRNFLVTDLSEGIAGLALRLFGEVVSLRQVEIAPR